MLQRYSNLNDACASRGQRGWLVVPDYSLSLSLCTGHVACAPRARSLSLSTHDRWTGLTQKATVTASTETGQHYICPQMKRKRGQGNGILCVTVVKRSSQEPKKKKKQACLSLSRISFSFRLQGMASRIRILIFLEISCSQQTNQFFLKSGK